MSENIKVSIELVDGAAKKALENFNANTEKADKNLNKLAKSGKDTFGEIGIHIGKATGIYDIFAGNLAANLATKAFDAMAAGANHLFQTFIVDGVKAASEQEKANQSLNVALAQTGLYSESTAKEFQDLASSIQATTGVQDDAVLTNAALIQSLGQLDKEGLKRATQAAVDLSAALGKDLSTTSEILGKAAGGTTTALTKLGISFREGATEAETFENILSAIEGRFGGAAAQKVNTFAGAVDLTKAAFGDLQEEVGNVIIQNNVVIELMKTTGKILGDLTNAVKLNGSSLKEYLGQGIIFAIDAFIVMAETADITMRTVTAAFRGAGVVVTFVANEILAVMYELGIASKSASDAMVKSLSDAVKSMDDAFSEESALNSAREMLVELKNGAEKGFKALKDGASTADQSLRNTTGGIDKATTGLNAYNEALKSWAQNLAKSTIDGEAALQAQIETLKLQKEEALLVNNDYLQKNAEVELQFLTAKAEAENQYYLEQQTKLAQAFDRGLITEAQYHAARQTLREKAIVAEKKSDIELTKFKNDQEKLRADNLKGSLSYISSLQQSSVKEFFFIGKAAALATAYIDAQAAVVKALASAPPPFNYALAGAVGLAAGVNIAKIASASPPAFEDGGIVPGNSFSGDKVVARVNSGEMVLNRSQQNELFKMANGQGSGSGSLESKLDALIGFLSGRDDRIVVNIGNKTIVDALRSELSAGRSFA